MARKKKSLKNRKNSRQRGRDEYTIVLEDIRSQFRLFGEGLGYAGDKLDTHTEQLKEIKDGLTNVDVRLKEVEVRLKEVEVRLADIKTELEFIRGEVALIRHNQVTRDEFRLLETRVARLERARRR